MTEVSKRSKKEQEEIANIVADKYIQDAGLDVFFPDGTRSSRELKVCRINSFTLLALSFTGSFTGRLDNTISLPESVLEYMLEEKREEKAAAVKQLKEAIAKIVKADAQDVCCMAALGYKRWTPPEFVREWTHLNTEEHAKAVVKESPYKLKSAWKISNAVFTCTLLVQELPQDRADNDNEYDIQVDWTVFIRDVRPGQDSIASLQPFEHRTIVYHTKQNDLDHIVSETKHMLQNKYFREDYPPIPESHRCFFVWAGRILPGYHLEGGKETCQNDL